MKSLLAELKRRNVYKVAVAYGVVGWLVVQISSTVLPTFHAPEWVLQTLVLLVVLGFPIALVLAWAFELTPEGVKRTEAVSPNEKLPRSSGHKFVAVIASLAVIAVVLLAFQLLRSRTKVASPALASLSDKSIAVLPFASLSEDKANAYFADGIQDEILTRLSKIAQLKVISRTSTEQYQSKPGNISEIARQLGVAHILEGSVQKSNDSVRVNVQLIKADGDSHLWAETYDRKLTDIFAVETEVAQRIASSLEAQLSGREQAQLANVPTKVPAAYDAYLRGMQALNKQGTEPLERAIQLFHQAVTLDPQYAQAWAQLGAAESQKSGYERTPVQLARAKEAVDTAMRAQPDLGEVHEGLAAYYYYGLHDLHRALTELEAAQSLSPNDASIIFYIGLIKRRQGKLDESIEYQRRASVLDPRNSDIWVNLGGTYRGKRDMVTAREMSDRALAISPDELDPVGYKAESYTAEGNLDAAEAVLRGYHPVPHTEAFYQTIYILECRRRFDDALALFAKAPAPEAGTPPLRLARRQGFLGELHYFAGHTDEARRLISEARRSLIALRESGNSSIDLLEELVADAGLLGDHAALDQDAESLRKEVATDKWRSGYSEQVIATAYAVMGDADTAIPIIEHALATESDLALTRPMLRQHPTWDHIRNDPRFQKLAGGGT